MNCVEPIYYYLNICFDRISLKIFASWPKKHKLFPKEDSFLDRTDGIKIVGNWFKHEKEWHNFSVNVQRCNAHYFFKLVSMPQVRHHINTLLLLFY